MATATHVMTAAEFLAMPDLGHPSELVRGEVVEMNAPGSRHGQICGNLYFAVRSFLQGAPLGHVVSNDAGIITARDPDSVRAPDLWYASYHKVAKGPLPTGYLAVAPDLVFEVLSPSDRWTDVLRKISEYLAAGVAIVCVVDFEEPSVHLYYDRKPETVLRMGDALQFPEQLPGFSLPLTELFE